MTDTQPLMLTVNEAAPLMGLSVSTLWVMIRNGDIAVIRGKASGNGERAMTRIERTEVDAWIDRNRVRATP